MASKGNRYLLHPDDEIPGKTTSLADEGIDSPAEALVRTLEESFERCFGVTFEPCGLTGEERKSAAGYMQEIA